MDEAQKATYRKVRGTLGLILAAAWIALRWSQLSEAKQAALAVGCGKQGIAEWLSDKIGGPGTACRSSIDSDFAVGIFLAVLVSPLAFWVAHYIAKWWVDGATKAEARAHERREEARRLEHQKTIESFTSETAREAADSQRTNARHELITRLGAVDDQLVVLESETDPARITRIKMTITQALREIDAKFGDQELQNLISTHSSVRLRVERTLSEMRRLGLGDGRQYQDLAGMFGLDDASEPARTDAGQP